MIYFSKAQGMPEGIHEVFTFQIILNKRLLPTMKKTIKAFGKRMTFASVNLFESPWGAALMSLFIYALVSAKTDHLFRPTEQAYYNYLADAFLHGQTWLRLIPPDMIDLSLFNNNLYLYWAPLPAVLLIPFVAAFGIQFNDVLFSILVASINVGLIAQLLRQACKVDVISLTKEKRAILVFFFAFGTVHFLIAPFGSVWFTGQLIGFLFTILAYLSAISLKQWKAWFFLGFFLACAMLTRNNLVFTGIFPALYLLMNNKKLETKTLIRNISIGLVPLFIGLVSYLYYNQIRFGNAFETGVNYQLMDLIYINDFKKYGIFSIHYIPRNFYYHYIFYPFPYRHDSLMGGSLFLLSPLFFGIFWAFKNNYSKSYPMFLVLSILITNIPILTVIGTGYWQIGPRYTLDFTVPLILLTAIGIKNWNKIVLYIFTAISTLHFIIGVKILSLLK